MDREQLLMIIPKLADAIVAPEVQQRLATEGKGDVNVMMAMLDEVEKKVLQNNGIEPESGFAELKMVGVSYGRDPVVMQAILQLADREEKLLMMMQMAQKTSTHSDMMSHMAPTATSMQMGAGTQAPTSMSMSMGAPMSTPTAHAPQGMSMSMNAPPPSQQQPQGQFGHQQHMAMPPPEIMQRAMMALPSDMLQKMYGIQQTVSTSGPGALTPEQQQDLQVIQQAMQTAIMRVMATDEAATSKPPQ